MFRKSFKFKCFVYVIFLKNWQHLRKQNALFRLKEFRICEHCNQILLINNTDRTMTDTKVQLTG